MRDHDHASHYTPTKLAHKIRREVGLTHPRSRTTSGLIYRILEHWGQEEYDLPVEVEFAADAIRWAIGSGRLPGSHVAAFRNTSDQAVVELLAKIAVNYQVHADVPPLLRAELDKELAS